MHTENHKLSLKKLKSAFQNAIPVRIFDAGIPVLKVSEGNATIIRLA
jgi:hypothetical protein